MLMTVHRDALNRHARGHSTATSSQRRDHSSACDACYQSKLRCDGGPPCQKCFSKKQLCIFSRKPGTRGTEILNDRARHLVRQLTASCPLQEARDAIAENTIRDAQDDAASPQASRCRQHSSKGLWSVIQTNNLHNQQGEGPPWTEPTLLSNLFGSEFDDRAGDWLRTSYCPGKH